VRVRGEELTDHMTSIEVAVPRMATVLDGDEVDRHPARATDNAFTASFR
jgi:hypothetical protein